MDSTCFRRFLCLKLLIKRPTPFSLTLFLLFYRELVPLEARDVGYVWIGVAGHIIFIEVEKFILRRIAACQADRDSEPEKLQSDGQQSA